MVYSFAAFTALTLSFASLGLAHLDSPPAAGVNNNKRHAAYLAARADAASSTFSPTFAIPTPTQVPGITVPALTAISSGNPVETPFPLFTTFAAGASPPISGAVPLPTGAYFISRDFLNFCKWSRYPDMCTINN